MSTDSPRSLFGPDRIQPGWPDTEWSVWITGMDEIHDQPDLDTALRAAAEHNAADVDIRMRDDDEFTPATYAVVLHHGYAWQRSNAPASKDKGEPTITAETARHVLWHFGHGGYPAGDWTGSLITLIARADVINRVRLGEAYPELSAAIDLAKNHDGGIERLQAIAGGAA